MRLPDEPNALGRAARERVLVLRGAHRRGCRLGRLGGTLRGPLLPLLLPLLPMLT